MHEGALPRAVVGKPGIECLLQPMARCHMSTAIHRDRAMAGSSFIRDSVPPHIQSRIDTSAKKSLGMTTSRKAGNEDASLSFHGRLRTT